MPFGGAATTIPHRARAHPTRSCCPIRWRARNRLEYGVLCTPTHRFMRSRIAKRLPPDADKLVGLSLALFASGSRTEDRFWEAKLDTLLAKVVRNGNQTTLDAALDHLQQNHPDA